MKRPKLRMAILGLAVCCLGSPAPADANRVENRLRTALDADPNHDAVRERLSVLLLRTGRTEAALFHARYLAKNASSVALRRQAGDLVARLDGPVWGWQPIFAIVPSSNLNKGATGDTIFVGDRPFTIDPDSRAKDGIGITLGVSAWRDWRLDEAWTATLSGSASATVYPDSDVETKQDLSTTVNFSRRIANKRLAFGATVDAQAELGELKRRRITPFVLGTLFANENRTLSARLEWSDVHYPKEPFRSGPTTRLTFGFVQKLSPRSRLRVSLPLSTKRTGRSHLDNESAGLSVQFDRLWESGSLRTSFGLAYGVDNYLGAFPGTGVKRRDKVTTLSLEVSHERFRVKGFVPTLRYEYTQSDSNIPLYKYDSHDVQMTFRKSF